MKRFVIIAALCAIIHGCGTTEPLAPRHSPEAELTLSKLNAAASGGLTMYGHQDDLMYGHSWRIDPSDTTYLRSDVEAVTGSYPAILGLDLGGIEKGDEKNLDSNYFSQIRGAARAHFARGGIVTYSWHLRNPLTGGDAWDVSSDKVVESVLPGGECHDMFLGWLSSLADFIESVGVPAIFRPWHENTGSWFWWGRDLCTVEQYKALWQMTYDYLVKDRGINFLLWAFSPGADDVDNLYMERYPGDGIIDIMGLDIYQSGDNESFMANMQSALGLLSSFAADHGKVMAVTETGLESLGTEKWWTGVLAPSLAGYPVAYALTWRNAPDKPQHFYAAWPGFEYERDFQDFKNLENILFIDGLQ